MYRKAIAFATLMLLTACVPQSHNALDRQNDAEATSDVWWTNTAQVAETAGDQGAIQKVLGPEAKAWRIVEARGQSALIAEHDTTWGQILDVGKGRGVTMEGLMRSPSETRFTAVLRLPTELAAAGTATINLATTDVKDAGLQITLRSSRRNDTISCAVRYQGKPLRDANDLARSMHTKTPNWRPLLSNGFNYQLRAYTKIEPGWPVAYRKQIEHDMSQLPDHNHKWLTLRVELGAGHIGVWLDDRMVAWKTEKSLVTEGFSRLHLSEGVQLAQLRSELLTPTPGYLTLPLGGYANASTLLDGKSIDPQSLPSPGRVVKVGDVPFVFSGMNAEGHDHIDVSRSFFRQGQAVGYSSTNGPMWAGSRLRDPARIQLRVPNGSYKALYVIAAYNGEPHTLPLLSAMFYRPDAGFSHTFTTDVPDVGKEPFFVASGADVQPLGVKLTNGKKANLYLVKIPLDPGVLSSLADMDVIEIELTKQVEMFRAYPDPIVYGYHQAGLPSGVQVYALSLQKQLVDFSFEPTVFGHVWTVPQKPEYTCTLTNQTDQPQVGTVTLHTKSYDASETTELTRAVKLPANTTQAVTIPTPVKLYGIHHITATLKINDETWTEQRNFCLLAPDRRAARWTPGKGALFGYWSYHGGHYTPDATEIVRLMTIAGARTTAMRPPGDAINSPYISKHWSPPGGNAWFVQPQKWALDDQPDQAKVEAFEKQILGRWNQEHESTAPLSTEQLFFFTEPHISPRLTSGNIPKYWNEKPYTYTDEEQTRIKMFVNTGKIAAELARKHFPEKKILIPWGDPLFVWPLLRAGFPTKLIDGSGVDIPGFERMPERQLHEQSIHRLYELKQEFAAVGIDDPYLQYTEGIFVPTEPGSVSYRQQMDIYQRWTLLSMAYGVKRFYSGWFAFDCGNYYGAEHYGGCGIQRRIPYCDPKPAYAAYATMTAILDQANFDGWVPTGSLSTYCLRFKGPNGDVYALWTLRGKRPVTLTLSKDGQVQITDSMNNAQTIKPVGSKVTVMTDPSVIYVSGAAIASVQVGESDNTDTQPTPEAKLVGDLGDGSWKYTNERDQILETNHWAMMRYLGEFSSSVVADATHGNVLQSTLLKQPVDRPLMPFYNVLKPAKPVVLPGAPAHVGLWVRGASDWGRVIYVLRDAKGERWTSIGTKDQYNCDDVHSWSMFNFDGWRYLRFELPGSSGWDGFRKAGTTWWRSDEGDGRVDLPVQLESVIVQQRTHILYVNDVQPAESNQIELGKLYVEYDRPYDATAQAVADSALQMPAPQGLPDLANPIAELQRTGALPPTTITKFTPPEHAADGTRVQIDFATVKDAKRYFIWVGPYADGRGAVNMTPRGATPGGLITRLHPQVKLYYWVIWQDAKGQSSKPSPAREQVLVDAFKEK